MWVVAARVCSCAVLQVSVSSAQGDSPEWRRPGSRLSRRTVSLTAQSGAVGVASQEAAATDVGQVLLELEE
jgi:hypothetical protein